jgi:protein involved in polysaccharide export with SLBB domain
MVRWCPVLQLVCLSALAALAGCSTSGGQLTLFPAGHRLIEPAKVLREVSGAPPSTGRELDRHPADSYVVEPGDVLLVQPAGLGSTIRLPGDQPVLPDGTIKLGKYGPLQVMGKTVEQIEIDVNERIKPTKDDDQLLVRLVSRESKVYYVQGEVNAPGSFQLKGRETVLDALLAAGGLNSNASRRYIILTRPTPPSSCRVVLPVNYPAIVQLGDTTTNYQIKAGDRVYVPTRCFLEDLKNLFGNRDCELSAMPCFPAGAPGHTTLPPPFPTQPDWVPTPAERFEPAAKVLPPTIGAKEKDKEKASEANSARETELGKPTPEN